MKRIITILAALGLFLYIPACAQTSISLGNTSAPAGDTAAVDLILNNSADVGGFQAVVSSSPPGTATFIRATVTGRAESWTVSSNSAGDSVSLLVFSPTGVKIGAGSEAVVQIRYLLSASAQPGTVSLSLSGAKVADTDLKPVAGVTVADGSITVLQAAAQGDMLSLSGAEVNPGEIAEVDLSLKNSLPVAGFQFTLSPASAEVSLAQITATGRAEGWTVSYNSTASGTEVIAYSGTGSTIAAGSGAVLRAGFAVSDQASPGTVALEISGLKVSDDSQNTITGFAVGNGTLTVNDNSTGNDGFARGDVNRDGKTDIFDLLELLGILSGEKEN